MGTPALANPFNPLGQQQSYNNAGMPVAGNTGTPMLGGALSTGTTNPFATTTPTPTGTNTGGLVSGNLGLIPAGPVSTAQTSTPAPTVGATPTAAPTTTGGTATPIAPPTSGTGVTPGSLDQQLQGIFGSGVGGLLGSEISNLGSDDSGYLQAYENSLAPINAENLATLQTTLGNEGISANSSVAGIAQGQFQANVASQEGLFEQQLEQTDIQDLLQLTQGLEKPAQEEVSSNAWNQYIEPLWQIASGDAKEAASMGAAG